MKTSQTPARFLKHQQAETARTITADPLRLTFMVILLLVLQTAGCVAPPKASPAVKIQAESFSPPPGKAGFYVIRPLGYTGDLLLAVSLDNEECAGVEQRSYIYGGIQPGAHVLSFALHSEGNKVTFVAEQGKNYFFKIKQGFYTAQIESISEAEGQEYVRKFKLGAYSNFDTVRKVGTK